MSKNYIDINRKSWNNRLEAHLQSNFYDMASFKKGKSSLNNIELDLLGNISGKKILHLQCHFGQDTLSLAKMGAKVTGVDLSDKAIDKARELNSELSLDATFICSNIYDVKEHIDEQFDIIFTTYGTISWLPDLEKWASIIHDLLKPNGQFVFVEFHPAVWIFDDDFNEVKYNYFRDEPIAEEESGSYADRDAKITNEYVCWNHGLSEVYNSLAMKNLKIVNFHEYDYAPYSFVNGMEEFEKGSFRIKKMGRKLPLVYSLVGVKG